MCGNLSKHISGVQKHCLSEHEQTQYFVSYKKVGRVHLLVHKRGPVLCAGRCTSELIFAIIPIFMSAQQPKQKIQAHL